MKKKTFTLQWRTPKRPPKIGGEFLVVWLMDDGGYPTTTMFTYDAIAKQWHDPQGNANEDVTENVLYWSHMPRPPRGISKKIYNTIDPAFMLPLSELPIYMKHMQNINELLS